MEDDDNKWMSQAIEWATDCHPVKESIPKVGAIIAIGEESIGRGRRGTGREGDDQHAEWIAINEVRDKTSLPKATLYTTLEPCTGEVRTNPLECCTELILQHKITKVFVGMLDPNQGVTGKGLWRLQDKGVEVQLFPHTLAKKIHAMNAAFIRAQQTLGATIVNPQSGGVLETTKRNFRIAVRFKCLNPPGTNNYLLCFHQGECWPQSGPFRQIEDRIWEIDASFGALGDHTLHLVTANDMGQTWVEYYRKIVRSNTDRRERLKDILTSDDMKLLHGDYPGIEMNGLPKGFRSEASLGVTVVFTK